jgi:hypothetical protein
VDVENDVSDPLRKGAAMTGGLPSVDAVAVAGQALGRAGVGRAHLLSGAHLAVQDVGEPARLLGRDALGVLGG